MVITHGNEMKPPTRGKKGGKKRGGKDRRLAPFGVVAHQSTNGIRTLSDLAVLREGLMAMRKTANNDGDGRQ